MKQAKVALKVVALLAVVGSAVAFKANRSINTFYAYTTTIIGGHLTGVCKPTVTLRYITHPAGIILITYGSLPFTNVTTCTARVAPSL